MISWWENIQHNKIYRPKSVTFIEQEFPAVTLAKLNLVMSHAKDSFRLLEGIQPI